MLARIIEEAIQSQADETIRRIAALHDLALLKDWEMDGLVDQFIEWQTRTPLGFWDIMRECRQRARSGLLFPWEEEKG